MFILELPIVNALVLHTHAHAHTHTAHTHSTCTHTHTHTQDLNGSTIVEHTQRQRHTTQQDSAHVEYTPPAQLDLATVRL
jgi:hypothetical protein